MIDPQKFSVYVTSDKKGTTHPFLTIRANEMNLQTGRYVLREEIYKAGLYWPNSYVQDRSELARRIGEAILTAAGV